MSWSGHTGWGKGDIISPPGKSFMSSVIILDGHDGQTKEGKHCGVD